MTKRYSILRKKLNEVESQLHNVLSSPPESTPYDQLLQCQDIEQKLGFVKTLLSAEIASHPSKPQHLKQMSRRLTELENIFCDYWNSFTLSVDDHHHGDHHDVHGHVDDAGSTCSCTESCLKDDGFASADITEPPSPQYKEPKGGNNNCDVEEDCVEEDYKELPVVVFNSGYNNNNKDNNNKGVEKMKEKVIDDDDDDDDDERDRVVMKTRSSSQVERRQNGSGVGMMCGAVVTGWLLGMISMGLVVMAGLSSSGFTFQFGEQQYGNFLTPT